MSLIRRYLALFVILLLTACATSKLTPDQASAIKRIGIISLLPQEVKYRKIGLTAFNNEYKTLPAGNVFNAAARRSAEEYFSASGKYQVKQIEPDNLQVLAGKLYSRSIVMSNNVERISSELASLAKLNNVDLIIVIGESYNPEQGIQGLEMEMRAGMGNIRAAFAKVGVQVAGVKVSKEIILNSYPILPEWPSISRPDGNPWDYALEKNLDNKTNQHVIGAMQIAVARSVLMSLKESGL